METLFNFFQLKLDLNTFSLLQVLGVLGDAAGDDPRPGQRRCLPQNHPETAASKSGKRQQKVIYQFIYITYSESFDHSYDPRTLKSAKGSQGAFCLNTIIK